MFAGDVWALSFFISWLKGKILSIHWQGIYFQLETEKPIFQFDLKLRTTLYNATVDQSSSQFFFSATDT